MQLSTIYQKDITLDCLEHDNGRVDILKIKWGNRKVVVTGFWITMKLFLEDGGTFTKLGTEPHYCGKYNQLNLQKLIRLEQVNSPEGKYLLKVVQPNEDSPLLEVACRSQHEAAEKIVTYLEEVLETL